MAKVKKVFQTVGRVVGTLLIVAILALLALVFISKSMNGTVFIFGRTPAWIMTASMEPEIPERSYVLIKKADPAEISVGDVIMFTSDAPALDGAFNTHRVVEIVGDGEEFVTKGDANIGTDAYTAKAENVVGVYEKNLPTLTAIGRYLYSSVGTITAIIIVCVIMMLMYLPNFRRAKRDLDREIEQRRRARPVGARRLARSRAGSRCRGGTLRQGRNKRTIIFTVKECDNV